ncbi:hypothetical protein [Bradyrhizobium sp. NP1]|jgi:hypothetical protein|uniref:hypothetical protein n=1 Tax=Bradyrhizobium sp. NP1 TaxID=3049772 RepID=UPI0025A64860|nr:hypothetical protein [Bradyrhizobium sp. NP1]WJR76228.1 hypothetical protein QOU61_26165 [Bradyrhizobium sp. NP1]
MSTDFSIRPVGAPAPSPVVPPPSKATNEAVTTELPASQSVTASDAAVSASNDPQLASTDISHQAYFDRTAATLVYQVVDQRTDQVVSQYPDDAVLRRRAYFHALDLTKASAPRALPTDRVA